MFFLTDKFLLSDLAYDNISFVKLNKPPTFNTKYHVFIKNNKLLEIYFFYFKKRPSKDMIEKEKLSNFKTAIIYFKLNIKCYYWKSNYDIKCG